MVDYVEKVDELKLWGVDLIEVHHVRAKDSGVVGMSMDVRFLHDLPTHAPLFAEYLLNLNEPVNSHQYLHLLDIFFNSPEKPDPFLLKGLPFGRDMFPYLILAMAIRNGRYKLEVRKHSMIMVISELPFLGHHNFTFNRDDFFKTEIPDGFYVSLPSKLNPNKEHSDNPKSFGVSLAIESDEQANHFCHFLDVLPLMDEKSCDEVEARLVELALNEGQPLKLEDVELIARAVKSSYHYGLFRIIQGPDGDHVYQFCFHCLASFGLRRIDRQGACL